MNYQVHITKQAEKDLNRALDYIEFSLKNPQAADSLLDETERTLNSLDQMPERYALPEDKLLAAWGIRFVQIKKYLAFYVIAKESQTAERLLRFIQQVVRRLGIFQGKLNIIERTVEIFFCLFGDVDSVAHFARRLFISPIASESGLVFPSATSSKPSWSRP